MEQEPAIQEVVPAGAEGRPDDNFVDFLLDQTVTLTDDEEDELSQAELAECTMPEEENNVEIIEVMEVIADEKPTHPETMVLSEVANIIDI